MNWYKISQYDPRKFIPTSPASPQAPQEASGASNAQIEVGTEGTYPVGIVEYPVKIIGKKTGQVRERGRLVDKELWQMRDLTTGRMMTMFDESLFKPKVQ